MKDVRCKEMEKLFAANNTEIKVLGKINVEIQYGDAKIIEEITICDTQKSDILLSWKCCQQLKIIPEDFPEPIKIN